MPFILSITMLFISVCTMLTGCYILVKDTIFRKYKILKNLINYNDKIGFGCIENDGADIVQQLNKQAIDFTSLSKAVHCYQKQIRKFSLQQSDEIQRHTKIWKNSINLLIELTDVIQLAISQNGSSNPALESLLRRINRGYEDIGITIINPKHGDSFDPETHTIIDSEQNNHPEGAIIETIRPGYTLSINNEITLIRPAEVVSSLGILPVCTDREDSLGLSNNKI